MKSRNKHHVVLVLQLIIQFPLQQEKHKNIHILNNSFNKDVCINPGFSAALINNIQEIQSYHNEFINVEFKLYVHKKNHLIKKCYRLHVKN